MQHESKPELVAELEREVLTMQIELEALRRETSSHAASRIRELQGKLHAKQTQAEAAQARWARERAVLEQRKTARQRLQQARADQAAAERDGDLARAGELTHAVLPRLEREMKQWESEAGGLGAGGGGESGSGESGGGMLAEQVTASHVAEVVSRATGIPANQVPSTTCRRAFSASRLFSYLLTFPTPSPLLALTCRSCADLRAPHCSIWHGIPAGDGGARQADAS